MVCFLHIYVALKHSITTMRLMQLAKKKLFQNCFGQIDWLKYWAQKRQKTPTQHPSRLIETLQNPSKLKYFKLFCTNACTIQQKDLTLHSQNNDGAIAQLVEQRTENPCVPGSIPGGTTKKQSSYPKVTAFFIPPPQKKHT